MIYNFDEHIERKGTDCAKWDAVDATFNGKNLLPLWIADMDFACPPCVVQAVRERAAHPIYGYSRPSATYNRTFARWVEKRHGWHIDPSWMVHSPGVVSAVAGALLAMTVPSDGVIIMPPVYHPFRITCEAQGRRVINCPMNYCEGRFEIDFERLAAAAPQAKAIILCNPHNPTGRVFTREELERIETVARENDLLVISDEIHADVVYSGHKHLPFAMVSPWAEEHSFVLMAPSKTFNIAGLATSTIVIPNDKLRYHFTRQLGDGLHIGGGSVFGLVACEAAYAGGEEWLDQLLTYLEGNVQFVETELAAHCPKAKLVHPEGIYVPLVDLSATGLSGADLGAFLRHAGLAMNDGYTFGPGGENFARLNIATPRANLKTFVEKLSAALK